MLLLFSGSLFALEYQEARHLLSRIGFGGTPAEIDELLPLTYEEAIDKLLDEMGNVAIIPAPEWTQENITNPRKNKLLMQVMSENQKKAYRKLHRRKQRQKGVQLKIWWYKQMIATKSPLTERMVLFLHNHFTSSLQKVKAPYLLYQQHMLFRKYLRGNFLELTHEIAKNPAMILYLDNQTNRKNKPNENFARELLELFTLGEGNYTENDIKQGARAFTGWMVKRKDGTFRFNRRQHDSEEKEFMGEKGNFNGENIIDIIFKNPKTAKYIVNKLWLEFIDKSPVESEINRLSNIFTHSNYEILPVLRALFLSPYFRDPKQYGKQIKSPVEFIVGTMRMFKTHMSNYRQLVAYGRRLGQDLFDPPNVKGWPGGSEWITSNSLLARRQMLERVLRGTDMFLGRFWVWHYLEGDVSMKGWTGLNNSQKFIKIQKVLLPIESVNQISKKTKTVKAIKNLVLDLSYQLK